MAALATLEELTNWEEYRAFVKERLKLLPDSGGPCFVSKEKLEFEIKGRSWKAHAVLLDEKGGVAVQKLRKEGVLFREGTCKRQGADLLVEGLSSKLVKECQKTFTKLVLGCKPFSADVPAGDGEAEEGAVPGGGGAPGHAHAHEHAEGDLEASSQTAPFTATQEPMLKQLAAELKKLGPSIKAAIESNENCRKTLTSQIKKADSCLKNKESEELVKLVQRIRDLLKEIEATNKEAARIEKLIDSAGWSSDDDRARALTAGMTKKQIQNLPTSTRNKMIAAMQSGNFSDDDKAAVKKLYSVNYIDPVFEVQDEKNRKAMVDKLSKDPEIKQAKKDWGKLNAADKIKMMQKVADIQAETYKIPKTTIATFNKGTHTGNDGKSYITEGYYNHKDGKLHMNTNNSSSFGNFNSAMATLTHENAHRYQSTLIDDLNAGKIKKGDPRYEQAVAFKLNEGFYTNDKPEYFTQPMETHSRMTGAAVDEALQAL